MIRMCRPQIIIRLRVCVPLSNNSYHSTTTVGFYKSEMTICSAESKIVTGSLQLHTATGRADGQDQCQSPVWTSSMGPMPKITAVVLKSLCNQ